MALCAWLYLRHPEEEQAAESGDDASHEGRVDLSRGWAGAGVWVRAWVRAWAGFGLGVGWGWGSFEGVG